MPAWIEVGFNDYVRRLPASSPLLLKEVKAPTRAGNGSGLRQKWMADEAARLRAATPTGSVHVVLDERGLSCTTAQLAQRIEKWKQSGRDIAFFIGGADGIARELKEEAQMLWSLSSLTLPHGLCRVILAEQIYRAVSLLAGHPYHRE